MLMNFRTRIVAFVFFLLVAESVLAKMWLNPEIIDDTEFADRLRNISASTTQNRTLYLAWENVINEEAPHSYNIFWKFRYPSFAWSDSHQITYHPFDTGSGAIYPNTDSNIGWESGDNVYLTYSSAGEGYILRHMATGHSSTIDGGYCGESGNGASFAAEDPHDYHVLFLKCPERRLYHNKFIETPTDHGWGTPRVITEAGHDISSYDIAVDHNRDIHIVWSENASGGSGRMNLFYLKHTEAAGWDATATLLSVASTIAGVKVKTDNNHNVHVIWRELDPSDHPTEDILYKTQRVGVWSDDINLSNGDETSNHPSLTTTSDNSVHVAWIAVDRRIAYRKWDGDWQPIVHLSDGNASRPIITSDSSNNLYLFYSGAKPPSPSATQLMLVRYADPSAHTPLGSDVRVELAGHSVTFDEVTEAGVTTIAYSSEGDELSSDFMQSCTPPQYFDITTSARYRAPIEICLTYDDSICNETDLQLLHNRGDRWENITSSIDPTNNIVCGTVFSLSEFALARPSSIPEGPPSLHFSWIVGTILALTIVLWIAFRRFPMR